MKLKDKKCVPCEGGVPPLTEEQENKLFPEVPDWNIDRSKIHKIKRTFKLKDFAQAMKFVNKVAEIAEAEGHHPNICITWNKVELSLYTHAINGLTESDFILAAKINAIKKSA